MFLNIDASNTKTVLNQDLLAHVCSLPNNLPFDVLSEVFEIIQFRSKVDATQKRTNKVHSRFLTLVDFNTVF